MIQLQRDIRTLHKNKYNLDADELAILQRHLGIVIANPETYEQIGESKQITKQRVEQLIRRALKKVGLKHEDCNSSPTSSILSGPTG